MDPRLEVACVLNSDLIALTAMKLGRCVAVKGIRVELSSVRQRERQRRLRRAARARPVKERAPRQPEVDGPLT